MAGLDLLIVLLLVLVGPRPPRTGRRGGIARTGAVTIVVLALIAVGAAAFAAAPKRGLVAAEKGIYDFGVVPARQAKRCEHIFLVRNTAKEAVRITGFKSSCGCTVAELPASSIPPGGSAEVRVRADWSGVAGSVYARVTLETDNRWTSRVPLMINGEIRRAATTSP